MDALVRDQLDQCLSCQTRIPTQSFRASVPIKSQSRRAGEKVRSISFVRTADDKGKAGTGGAAASTRGIAAVIKNGRTRMSLGVCVLVASGSSQGAPVANEALALGGGTVAAIDSSGFRFARHAFEISGIGRIRLLRTKSTSCIVHEGARGVCRVYRPRGSPRH